MTVPLEDLSVVPTSPGQNGYHYQTHFIAEDMAGSKLPWEPLQERGLERLGLWMLRLMHWQNNSVLNTGFRQWEAVMTYRLEGGDGYDSVYMTTLGDFGSRSGTSSMIRRTVRVIQFEGSKKIRVRYMITRYFHSPGAGSDPRWQPYLMSLIDKDYEDYGDFISERAKTIAFDMVNHLGGSMLFQDDEPVHPVEPPIEKDQRYQTVTSIAPIVKE